jgi:hypothetical protein
MDIICIDEIKNLIQRSPGLFVSIYLPTHHTGGSDPQDPIRLKNLIRQGEDKLTRAGLRTTEARVMLEPIQRLVGDNMFWRQQSDGLAIFVHNNNYAYYQVPSLMDETVVVTNRFHIKPLLSLLNNCGWYYVLALSRNEIRLLQCTEFNSIRVRLEGVPKNLDEYMQSEVPDARITYHSSTQASGAAVGSASAVQSGEGSKANYDKNTVYQYFEKVNKGVFNVLKDEKAPLVLTGVDYLLPIYRKANNYNNLIAGGIDGNPETWTDDVLRQQAWKIVKPYFDKSKQEAMAQFNQSAGTGLTSTDIKEIITNAHSGRIRFLFLAKGANQWCTYDATSNDVILSQNAQQSDEDLLDLAAFETLAHAGTVYIVDRENVPGNTAMSAVLRY